MPPSRRFLVRFVLASMLGLIRGLASEGAPSALEESAARWNDDHQSLLEKAADSTMAGDVAAANRLLIDAANRDSSPSAAFVVGNLLYRCDPRESYRFHARALAALPTEPATALEMAMEQHRRGEWQDAIRNYQKGMMAAPPAYSALLADCYVHAGQLREAVDAWGNARHGSNHTGIDFAICEIYGPLLPTQRRGELWAKVKAGDRSKIAPLILLDLDFDSDWWNAEVFAPGLEADLKLAAQLLGADSAEYRQLTAYAKAVQDDNASAEGTRATLSAAKLVVGSGAVLPADSAFARHVCELAMRRKAATAVELWHAHERALRQRLPAKDRDALHLLTGLALDADPASVSALERLGWKEWKDPEFAPSYIADLAQAKKLTRGDDPELLAAIKAVPDSTKLQRIRLQLLGETAWTPEFLAEAIKAEYHKLSVGMGIRDSYTLKALFYALAEKLDHAGPKQTAKP